jgi:hypothetical protein
MKIIYVAYSCKVAKCIICFLYHNQKCSNAVLGQFRSKTLNYKDFYISDIFKNLSRNDFTIFFLKKYGFGRLYRDFFLHVAILLATYCSSWIYSYLYNQWVSQLKLWVLTPFMARWTRYNKHYVIKFVSDLRQVGDFHRVPRFAYVDLNSHFILPFFVRVNKSGGSSKYIWFHL